MTSESHAKREHQPVVRVVDAKVVQQFPQFNQFQLAQLVVSFFTADKNHVNERD